LNVPNVVQGIDVIQQIVREFDWNGAVENTQMNAPYEDQLLSQGLKTFLNQIFTPSIKSQIKEFATNYIEDIRNKVIAKQWDDLSLPNFHLEWIQNWMARIRQTFRIFSYLRSGAAFAAGPVSFIIIRFVMPTIFSWLKMLVKRLFVASESLMLQVLVGLDDVYSDISNMILFLSQNHQQDLLVKDVLENVAPLLKNKAIALLINQFGASQGWNMTAVMAFMPALIALLEPYRAHKLKDLMQSDIIMNILLHLLQSDVVEKWVGPEAHQIICSRIQSLSPHVIVALKDCSMLELVALIKVLAHPTFNQFLNELPEQYTYQDFLQWRTLEVACLPLDVQAPVTALRSYQNNHLRLAHEKQMLYHNLKQKFTLNVGDIQAHLLKLKSKPGHALHWKEETPSTGWSWLWQSQCLKIAINYLVLVVANYLLFQFSLFLVSATFLVLLTVPRLYGLLMRRHTIEAGDHNIVAPLETEYSIALPAVLPSTPAETWPLGLFQTLIPSVLSFPITATSPVRQM
ncbi:MAG TPA: hypothetical protein VHD33_07060, partial [Legionellaceae bacterium]|nr:hypothetical protein [Legionellaceae bacterium]